MALVLFLVDGCVGSVGFVVVDACEKGSRRLMSGRAREARKDAQICSRLDHQAFTKKVGCLTKTNESVGEAVMESSSVGRRKIGTVYPPGRMDVGAVQNRRRVGSVLSGADGSSPTFFSQAYCQACQDGCEQGLPGALGAA